MFKFSIVQGLRPGVVDRVEQVPSIADFFAALPQPTIDDSGNKRDDAPLVVMGEADVGAVVTNATWRGSRTVMLDVDGDEGGLQPPPLADVVAKAHALGYAFAAGPSRRHTEQTPRYRVVVALADDVKSIKVYAETAKHLAQELGLIVDPRSFVPSQRWYGFTPTHQADGPGAPLRFAALNRVPTAAEIADPVRRATPGTRRHLLFSRAAVAGRLAHCLAFPAEQALNELLAAARIAGLTDDDDAERHIRRGFTAGLEDPQNTLAQCPTRPQAAPDNRAAWAPYQSWQTAFRTAIDTSIRIIEHGSGRVLYRVGADARQLTPYASKEAAVSLVRGVAEEAGLAVGADLADTTVRDLLTRPTAHASGVPSLFDTGSGYYLYALPRRAPGPTPAWDEFLTRLSDADAFLAHVHAVFEPRWKGRQVLWLQGGGNDGKSLAFTAIAKGTFGFANLASMDDETLAGGSQFVYSTCWNKPLTIVPDTKNVNLVMKGRIHRLMGRDPIPIEYKHRDTFTAAYQGEVWVTSNPMPAIENNRSNMSRLTVLTVAPHGDFIPNLEQKYIEEMPALLAKAAEAYARREKDHFRIRLNERAEADLESTTTDVKDKYAVWAQRIDLAVTKDRTHSCKSSDIYHALEKEGIRAGASERAGFYSWLEQQGATMESRSDYKRFFGVQLRHWTTPPPAPAS